MTQRSYLGWQRYWDAEPWGSWRDNFHAAIIAREVRRTIPGVKSVDMARFFYKDPGTVQTAEQKMFAALGVMAEPVSPKEAARRIKAGRTKAAKRKKRRDRPR